MLHLIINMILVTENKTWVKTICFVLLPRSKAKNLKPNKTLKDFFFFFFTLKDFLTAVVTLNS